MIIDRSLSPRSRSLPAQRQGGAKHPLVIIVDDDSSVREALSELILSAGFRPASFASTQDLLEAGVLETPGCLILDVRMPGASGLHLQHYLVQHGISKPVIFLTAHGDIPMTVQAMKAGAVDFLTKPFSDTDLMAAIRAAIAQDQEKRSARAELRLLRRRYCDLTPRERDVLPLVVSGLLNKQAAAELGISEVTLQIHRRNVMQKMVAASLADLVRIAERLGIEITHSRRAGGDRA